MVAKTQLLNVEPYRQLADSYPVASLTRLWVKYRDVNILSITFMELTFR